MYKFCYFCLFSNYLDFDFKTENGSDEILFDKENGFPLCNCETPGEVRPNVILNNDSTWNS